MKTFFTIFFAILAAAGVIFSGLWAKSRVDAWEIAWRSGEAQISAIVASHQQPVRTSDYASSSGSLDVAMERLREAESDLKRIQADQPRVVDLERYTINILEQKPFSLPLTASERKELAALKDDLQKLTAK